MVLPKDAPTLQALLPGKPYKDQTMYLSHSKLAGSIIRCVTRQTRGWQVRPHPSGDQWLTYSWRIEWNHHAQLQASGVERVRKRLSNRLEELDAREEIEHWRDVWVES